ncbi:MAG: PhnD/SsuA/transferrin family substrate-binding protein, partial [Magnetococcus sp. YQC-9]
ITRHDAAIQTLEELVDKRFAFGDANSTMSHLMPRAMLLDAGIPTTRLAGVEFLSNHANVVLGVLSGLFDAGATREGIFLEHQARGLKAIAWTPPLPTHLFVARTTLPASQTEQLRHSLLQLAAQPDGKAILQSVEATITGILPAEDAEYDSLRVTLRRLQEAGVEP